MNNGDDHWHRDLGRCILRNSHGDSRGDLRGDSGGDQIEVVAHDQGQRNAIAVRIKGYEMQYSVKDLDVAFVLKKTEAP